MKEVLFLSVLLFGIHMTNGQSARTDSLFLVQERAKTPQQKAAAYRDLANALFEEKNMKPALSTLSEAMLEACESGLIEEAKAHYTAGKAMFQTAGNPSAQLAFYLEARDLAEQAKARQWEGEVCNDLGNLYMRQNETDIALGYFESAEKIARSENNLYELGMALSNIGIVYKRKGDIERAMAFYNEALETGEKIGYTRLISASHNNMAVVMEDRGEYENALHHFSESLKIDMAGNSPEDLSISQHNVGMTLRKLKRYAEAWQMLMQAAKTSMNAKLYYVTALTYEELATLEAQNKRFKEAYEFQKLKGVYADSAALVTKAQEFSEMQLRLEFENKETLLKSEQDKREALAREALRRNELRSYALGGGLFLSLLLALVIWRSYLRKRKDNQLIQRQKKDVESKNLEITESITYAKRIQSAILPPLSAFDEAFSEAFVFYLPKDIVAGDFFWLEKTNDFKMVAAADCTGHGVPGALVSIICHNALKRSVREYGLTTPGAILDKTREIVISEFEKSTEDVKDGMDISLLCINKNEVLWAGANHSLIHFHRGLFHEIKGDKQPIGKSENHGAFTTHTCQVNKGDVFYLFTDGYCDQFGGPSGKKFKSAALKSFLSEIHTLPLHEQKKLLAEKFRQWRGALEQVDDVCIIGIKM